MTTTTLAERLTRTGEAILDLAAALPADLDLTAIRAAGYDYGNRLDVELHIGDFAGGLRAIAALGGIWPHTLYAPEPGANKVHHYWTGEFQGWTVRITAIWDGRDLYAEDIVPMVGAVD